MENSSILKQNFIDRLEIFMETLNLNNNQLSNKAGLSNGLLGKARKNRSAMNSDSIEQILYAYPNLNADWLITGRGEMLNIESSTDNAELQKETRRLKEEVEILKAKNDKLNQEIGYWKKSAGVELKSKPA